MMTSNDVFYLQGFMQSHGRAAPGYGKGVRGERACVCGGGGGERERGVDFSTRVALIA